MKSKPGLLLATALLLSGCATKNPEWLASPVGAFCTTGLNETCLQGYSDQIFTEATDRLTKQSPGQLEQEQDTQVQELHVTDADADADVVDHESAEPSPVPSVGSDDSAEPVESATETSTPSKPLDDPSAVVQAGDHLERLVFGMSLVGAMIKASDQYELSDKAELLAGVGELLATTEPSKLIETVYGIEDEQSRAEGLVWLLSTHSSQMSNEDVTKALNDLFELDQSRYEEALFARLPSLLSVGDLERARALRVVLLQSRESPDAESFALAFVASSYAMAGLAVDALEIIQNQVAMGTSLSDDQRKLIGMAIRIGEGWYPLLQEFYDYRSDQVRLEAYLTFAAISLQLDRRHVAERALREAVIFMQKSTTKIDRERALGQVLLLSSAIVK